MVAARDLRRDERELAEEAEITRREQHDQFIECNNANKHMVL